MKKFLAVLVLAFLSSCSIINKPCTTVCPPDQVCIAGNCVPIPAPGPEPTPTPTPEPPPPPPPEPQCRVGQEDCECFVLKPGDEEWTKLECQDDRVCVARVCTEPNTPPPPPPPPPPPVSCANLPAENMLVPAVLQRPATKAGDVIQAMRELGDLSLGPGYSNDLYHQRSRENLKKLAAKLCERGITAFAGKEAVFVLSDDGLWEEYHAVYFGDSKWIPSGKYIGVHTSPVITDACPAKPCPIRRWTRETLPPGWGDNEIGRSAWKFNAKPHTMGNADSTPVTIRQETFCASIGMSPDANGVPRASCPVRPEDWPIDGERVKVETWLLEGGPVRERCVIWLDGVCRGTRRDNSCDPNNTTNPFAFLSGTGSCRVCNTPGDTCSVWL